MTCRPKLTRLTPYALPLLALGTLGSAACGGTDELDAAVIVDSGSVADSGVRDTGVVADAGSDAGVETLYDRLGGESGIKTVMEAFVGRVAADAKINGYFLNSSVNGTRLITCLTKQVGALTGGPQTYPTGTQGMDADGCRNMTEAHGGLGISNADFTDLAGHLAAELDARGVSSTDKETILGAVAPLKEEIVERPNDDEQIYNRIGRKPAVQTVITDFIGRVVADPKINGYFLNSRVNAARLSGCLVRQVCGLVGGPCKYREEIETTFDKDGNGTVETAELCGDMMPVHAGLGISDNDYTDLANHLVDALTAAGVPAGDVATIATVLTGDGLKSQIIEDATNNGTIYQRIGRKPAVTTVINAFVGAVAADPKINGYFLNSSLDGARLGTCLVRQVCQLSGGPCKYGEEVESEIDRNKNGTVETTEVCRDMLATHATLGISRADFDDLATHLVAELTTAGVSTPDVATIATVLTSTALVSQIVENPNNNENIYQRLGRKPAVATVISDFVGRVVANQAINGYFLNSAVDGARLTTCLVRQVCQITGGPCKYGEEVESEIDRDNNGTVETTEVCRDMMATHLGLGISQNDYNDLAGNLVGALSAANAEQTDIDAIVATLTQPGLVGQIVEDPSNDATVYQRVGRKPALVTVVNDLINRVTSDNSLVGFFGNLNVRQVNRLKACLVRQVCNIDGPCRYGQEVLESAIDVNNNMMLDSTEVCRDMVASHAGLTNPDTANSPISIADFNALVGHLSMSMTMAGVTNTDRDAVINGLAPLCTEIVDQGTGCPP